MTLRAHFQKLISNTGNNLKAFYPEMNKYIRTFKPDRITGIGAYTGVGKSYAVTNLLDHVLLTQPELKVLVVSTEMSEIDYEARIILMRAGAYEDQLEAGNNAKITAVKEALDNYTQAKYKNVTFLYENIWENFAPKAKDYDLIIIDYIQDVVIMGEYKPEHTMPILSHKLKELKEGRHVIAVSQVNNKHQEQKLNTLPYAYGVEFSRVIAHGIVMARIQYKDADKFQDKYTDYLLMQIAKNRYGQEGKIVLKIHPGHRMKPLTVEELQHLESIKDTLTYY
jgi:replicative DNA helicase